MGVRGEYIAIDHGVTMYGVPRTSEEVDGIVAIAMRSLSILLAIGMDILKM
jgi:hypothetical protein